MFKVVTFNINGIRARKENFIPFLKKNPFDIIGLQETKVDDSLFPEAEFTDLGYNVYFHGQKSHYGVATLATETPLSIQKGFVAEKDQKRIIITEHSFPGLDKIFVINGYFPQGESRQHPVKFPYKMSFYDQFIDFLKQTFNPKKDAVIVMGDLNISPEDKDIGIGEKNAKRWLQTGKCSFLPEEREKIATMKNWGLYDVYRELYPNVDHLFTWFDYRSKGFDHEPKRGLRIDHIWVTKVLLDKCIGVEIDYTLRSGDRPSDHCPVVAEFK